MLNCDASLKSQKKLKEFFYLALLARLIGFGTLKQKLTLVEGRRSRMDGGEGYLVLLLTLQDPRSVLSL